MSQYFRLSFVEREEISRQIASNQSIRSIARQLNRSAGTISREIIRSSNNKNDYRAIKSQKLSQKRRHKPTGKRKLDTNKLLREFVLYYLIQNSGHQNKLQNDLKLCILITWICIYHMKLFTAIYMSCPAAH